MSVILATSEHLTKRSVFISQQQNRTSTTVTEIHLVCDVQWAISRRLLRCSLERLFGVAD